MTDATDMARRLRGICWHEGRGLPDAAWAEVQETADILESQAARIAELERENERLMNSLLTRNCELEDSESSLAATRSELEALKRDTDERRETARITLEHGNKPMMDVPRKPVVNDNEGY